MGIRLNARWLLEVKLKKKNKNKLQPMISTGREPDEDRMNYYFTLYSLSFVSPSQLDGKS